MDDEIMNVWSCYEYDGCEMIIGVLSWGSEVKIPMCILLLCYDVILSHDIGFVMKGIFHPRTYELWTCYIRG